MATVPPSSSIWDTSVCAQDEVAARVSGRIPDWLRGTLVRNGPAQFEVGPETFRHWFDGLSQLHRFTIGHGQEGGAEVRYLSAPLQSGSFKADTQQRRIAVSEFGTHRSDDPCQNIFGRFFSKFRASDSDDNANISVAQFGHRTVAVQERRHGLQFDPNTLAVKGRALLGDGIAGQTTTAHPHFSADGSTVFNLTTHFGPRSSYHLFSEPSTSSTLPKAHLLASIPVERPGYVHSFGQSERHLVLMEFPLTASSITLATMNFTKKSYTECFEWGTHPHTRLFLVDKNDGRVIGPYTAPPCFAFHHVSHPHTFSARTSCTPDLTAAVCAGVSVDCAQINAFEEKTDAGVVVHVDVACYDDASVINTLYLNNLRHQTQPIPRTSVRRFTVPLPLSPSTHTPLPSLTPRVLYPYQVELPRIAYSLHSGRPYRFVYGLGHDDELNPSASTLPINHGGPTTLFTRIVKLDVTKGMAVEWREAGCHPSEPLYVPRPGGQGEDEGVVVSVVLRPEKRESFLLVLDAATMEELARATVTALLPVGLHGMFVDSRGQAAGAE